MRLKNSRDVEREFELILKIEKDIDTYIVYHDHITDKLYSGKIKNKKLKALSEDELDYVNKVLERISG